MASSSNYSMMSTIDSLKEKMSDEVYLALCDKMKELHNEPTMTMIPVRIWFMIVETCYIDPDQDPCGELYEVVPVQRIVMMTRVEMEKMKNTIETSSRHTETYSFNNPTNVDFHTAPRVSHVDPLKPYEVEVFRVEAI